MDKFYNEILSKQETAINELEIEADCSIQRVEAVIHLVLESLSNLKEYVGKGAEKVQHWLILHIH